MPQQVAVREHGVSTAQQARWYSVNTRISDNRTAMGLLTLRNALLRKRASFDRPRG